MDRQAFIDIVAQSAIEECRKVSLFPSICIAQACLESNYGTSELAVNANNIFGKKWNPGKYEPYYKNTREYLKCTLDEAITQGFTPVNVGIGLYEKPLPFNSYPTIQESISHYCINIMTAPWYSIPRMYLADYDRFLTELAIVYAPNHPTYPQDIMRVIEQYGLKGYDEEG